LYKGEENGSPTVNKAFLQPSTDKAMLNYLCRAKPMKHDVWKNIAGIYGQGRRTYGLDACIAKPYLLMK